MVEKDYLGNELATAPATTLSFVLTAAPLITSLTHDRAASTNGTLTGIVSGVDGASETVEYYINSNQSDAPGQPPSDIPFQTAATGIDGSFTIDIVGPKLIPNAVALAQISMNSNRVIGPALAGVFLGVTWLSFAGIYLFSAGLSVLAVICFLFLDSGLPNPDRPQRAPLVEMADGFRYASSVPSLRIVVSLAILVTMVGFPYIAFLPSVSEDFFGRGSEGFALLSLVGAAGGLLAGVGVARTVLAQGPRVQVVSGVMLAVGLLFMSWAPTFNVALIAAVVVGGSTAGFQSMNATLALSLSDSDYHGRIQSLLGLGFSAFGLVSYPLGLLADAIGLRETLAGMGVITFVLVVGAELFWRTDRGEIVAA